MNTKSNPLFYLLLKYIFGVYYQCQHKKPDNINSLVINVAQRVNLRFCNSCRSNAVLYMFLMQTYVNIDLNSYQSRAMSPKNKLKMQKKNSEIRFFF